MKKWLFAWVVLTSYVIVNMSMMETAEQPHLVATLLLGLFFYLIFGMRGLYGAMITVVTIVVLALLVHPFRQTGYRAPLDAMVLIRLVLDLITIGGGGGIAYWCKRLLARRESK